MFAKQYIIFGSWRFCIRSFLPFHSQKKIKSHCNSSSSSIKANTSIDSSIFQIINKMLLRHFENSTSLQTFRLIKKSHRDRRGRTLFWDIKCCFWPHKSFLSPLKWVRCPRLPTTYAIFIMSKFDTKDFIMCQHTLHLSSKIRRVFW